MNVSGQSRVKFWGIPLVLWSLLCLLLALVWIWVWPADRANPEDGLRFMVLRWFHALTWLLLALSLFSATRHVAWSALTRPLAFAALLVYLVFLAVFITNR